MVRSKPCTTANTSLRGTFACGKTSHLHKSPQIQIQQETRDSITFVRNMSDRAPSTRWVSEKIKADAQYVNKWLDPYFSVDRYDFSLLTCIIMCFRYDKLLKPRLELIVRNLNRPNDDKETDPVLLDTYRLVCEILFKNLVCFKGQ